MFYSIFVILFYKRQEIMIKIQKNNSVEIKHTNFFHKLCDILIYFVSIRKERKRNILEIVEGIRILIIHTTLPLLLFYVVILSLFCVHHLYSITEMWMKLFMELNQIFCVKAWLGSAGPVWCVMQIIKTNLMFNHSRCEFTLRLIQKISRVKIQSWQIIKKVVHFTV